ncbi:MULTISPECIES: PTS sugar transporter subunit IIA [Thermoanaerobacterium]|uniref:PTS system glucose subfamily transporter subunit IIA n=2 Tax=Thermoanaerobacterium TaxID=28895 RepID=W9EEV9_9THEO|nr:MULTISPECIES: PTS glucose transporter subunit IIA [Thermoanaerobacterium]AFK85144.1 PTS system, glucose subfamily, IIA subunit [Thermoanaerobacterium saccharolyticum JW/SL-YS485]ETO39520.1 PTS system glucose subfamily transporter subunit IIA [Thermoanaerobacterium aotearoense SCUT27]
MLNIFRKSCKRLLIKAPVDGEIVDIVKVPDEVFAQKLVGDGVAVNPKSDIFVSPVDGIITTVFPTKHAIGIKTIEGIEIMIHVGVDTVKLNGEGFTTFINEGDKVKVGDKLLQINKLILESKAKSLISPIIITNIERIKEMNKIVGTVTAGETDIIEAVI